MEDIGPVIGLMRNYIIYFYNLIFTSSNSNTGEYHLRKGMQEVKIKARYYNGNDAYKF